MKAWRHFGEPPERWNTTVLRGISGLALLAQLPLVWAKIDGSYESRLISLLVFLPLGVPLLFGQINFPGWLQMGVAAGAVGGLAMIVGDHLDHAGNENAMSCCLVPDAGMAALLNWSNGLMVPTCAVSCILLHPGDRGSLGKPIVWLKHLCCSGGMWLGMILGGHLLICLFRETFGKMVGMHIAMVIGMTAGAAISQMLFWRSRDCNGLKDN
jgi:hypothetical protein